MAQKETWGLGNRSHWTRCAPSGQMIENLVVSTLQGLGINAINTGLSTTPTAEMYRYNAQGGIILTASHNPKQWNALGLLNEK